MTAHAAPRSAWRSGAGCRARRAGRGDRDTPRLAQVVHGPAPLRSDDDRARRHAGAARHERADGVHVPRHAVRAARHEPARALAQLLHAIRCRGEGRIPATRSSALATSSAGSMARSASTAVDQRRMWGPKKTGTPCTSGSRGSARPDADLHDAAPQRGAGEPVEPAQIAVGIDDEDVPPRRAMPAPLAEAAVVNPRALAAASTVGTATP